MIRNSNISPDRCGERTKKGLCQSFTRPGGVLVESSGEFSLRSKLVGSAQARQNSQLLIRPHNETLSVAMRVCNPDRSPFKIESGDPAQTPFRFAEVVGDDFPVLHSSASGLRNCSDFSACACSCLTNFSYFSNARRARLAISAFIRRRTGFFLFLGLFLSLFISGLRTNLPRIFWPQVFCSVTPKLCDSAFIGAFPSEDVFIRA